MVITKVNSKIRNSKSEENDICYRIERKMKMKI